MEKNIPASSNQGSKSSHILEQIPRQEKLSGIKKELCDSKEVGSPRKHNNP